MSRGWHGACSVTRVSTDQNLSGLLQLHTRYWVWSSTNLADMGTKHLGADDIDICLERISCYLEDGRSQAVASIAKIIVIEGFRRMSRAVVFVRLL